MKNNQKVEYGEQRRMDWLPKVLLYKIMEGGVVPCRIRANR